MPGYPGAGVLMKKPDQDVGEGLSEIGEAARTPLHPLLNM